MNGIINNDWVEQQYKLWCEAPLFDEATRQEMRGITDPAEILDRFRKELKFGTGGLRGSMGAGLNRMNGYVVQKATAGLANFLLKNKDDACRRGVAIAYDSRNHSREFADAAAATFSAKGFKVYIFSRITPTPVLSYAVAALHCCAGIVITASHNPKEYNGYKVYDETGCQVTDQAASDIYAEIQKIDLYQDLPLSSQKNGGVVQELDESVLQSFIKAVMTQSVLKDSAAKAALNVRYTPLHGTGRIPVSTTLQEAGFSNVSIVEEQADENGNFPTVKTPNPEDREALSIGIAQASDHGDDLVLGTDPDCDRVGVAVFHHGAYQLLTGNQIGALLIWFLLEQNSHPADGSTVVKTIVTNDLGAEIAKSRGLQVVETLTGFKYIGEQINRFQSGHLNRFFMGYEESFGFLIGTHARDKDAVVSSLLICELAAWAKHQGKTLIDCMDALYHQYGFYMDALETITLNGAEGEAQILKLMEKVRENPGLYFTGLETVVDYQKGVAKLPPSNVIKLFFTDHSWIAVRPSGTEPKIKFYYSARGTDAQTAKDRLTALKTAAQKIL